jgi:hypothetical protein
MSKEKQIEEIAKIINESVDYTNPCADEKYGGFACLGCDYLEKDYCQHDVERAKGLYNAGYRKQEWISVKDRLPTHEDGKVLIYTAYGISIGEKTVSNHWRGNCAIPKQITHWMPLPEPPKGENNE